MRKKRPARTVLEVCVAKAGPVKGGRIAAFGAQWAIASQALGRPITIEDYCEWWGVSEATAYRHQAEWRRVFPHMRTPQPIADVAARRSDEWLQKGVRGFGALPADVVPAAA